MRRTTIAVLIAPALLLIIALAAPVTQAGGGCHMPDGSVYTEGEATVIRMDTCSFSPTIARAAVGTQVRFLNTSTIEHAVVGRAGTFDSQILSPGSEYSATFAAAGTYPFSCPLHPGMVGAIVVGGEAAAPAAPAVTSTGAEATTTEAAAAVDQNGTDPGTVIAAGAAGAGVGAIVAALAAVAKGRRRSGEGATGG